MSNRPSGSTLVSIAPTNKVWGKVTFSQACVSYSVHRRGICLWVRGSVCLWVLGGVCLKVQGMCLWVQDLCTPLGHTLLPWTPPETHTQTTPDTHTLNTPPGHTPTRSTSGRYASYWNAFLLSLNSVKSFRENSNGTCEINIDQNFDATFLFDRSIRQKSRSPANILSVLFS